jgi:hypothetical protein
MRHFYCTHFDSNYLGHAKNLLGSLNDHDSDFTIFMFCFDQVSFNCMKELNDKNAVPIFYKDLEGFFPQLKVAKDNRNFVEFFFTCSPAICKYVFSNFPEVDLITYLDADLFFFDSPNLIYEEMEGNSIGIISHKFNFFTKRNRIYGEYNVGWVSFRRDQNGVECLNDWMKECIDWCYQKLEKNRFADQKYLDFWPNRYEGVKVISNIGANVAIWNIKNYKLSLQKGKPKVNGHALIFYHFANLKQIDENLFTTDLSRVFVSLRGVLLNNVYIPYINLLKTNKLQSVNIKSKKDNHVVGLKSIIRELTRKVRAILFKDKINLNKIV